MEEEKKQDARLKKTLDSELEWVRSNPKARQTKSKARLTKYQELLDTPAREALAHTAAPAHTTTRAPTAARAHTAALAHTAARAHAAALARVRLAAATIVVGVMIVHRETEPPCTAH